MDKKRVEDALEYAVASNRIEDLNITESELENIRNDILRGNDNDSYLYSIVKKTMEDSGELERDSIKHGKNRK